jgi:hypothetical protein
MPTPIRYDIRPNMDATPDKPPLPASACLTLPCSQNP